MSFGIIMRCFQSSEFVESNLCKKCKTKCKKNTFCSKLAENQLEKPLFCLLDKQICYESTLRYPVTCWAPPLMVPKFPFTHWGNGWSILEPKHCQASPSDHGRLESQIWSKFLPHPSVRYR